MKRKRVVVLGATGSIGQSARKVARDIPDRMEIVGLSAHSNAEGLREALAEFPDAKAVLSSDPNGEERLIELAQMPEADMVLIAIVGTGGLRPALAAIEAGKDIAVASKEILVLAGEAVMTAAARKGVNVLPVDSEHNAIFQCLDGRPADSVRRLILTCSGGPFRQTPAGELESVTPERALKHPTWSMGRKISIDSATLFNKGLEMIEARWLFGVPMDKVDVIVHPQSIVHSMVEFTDSSVLAQLSHSDMCFPIQYAVTWPDRVANSLRPLDFAQLAKLDFEAPRREVFPALDLAHRAGSEGGTLPAVLNAANEVAVDAFLNRRLAFPAIWRTVERAMNEVPFVAHPSLDELLEADRLARTAAAAAIG
ncbi:MAG: 1-deoxy-D-xylulose-5-phosphate reductoisomerase [Verrucomicrobia bacterium 61-8]|nr:1-deoxy-D-xylulose-5-phosphate reductoisomerase [Verrucomicrobiota bacterium]OJV16311.1 MAG: 1-deoxy-D-xylulose-5-phosphate reductoisomerase [Verrucomicrobia bacterium 61-8]